MYQPGEELIYYRRRDASSWDKIDCIFLRLANVRKSKKDKTTRAWVLFKEHSDKSADPKAEVRVELENLMRRKK